MGNFIDVIKNKFNDKQKSKLIIDEFEKFLIEYTEPSFGSMPKSDINIKIFNIMRNIGLISEDPDAWEVISMLKLKRSTANNLIYDANIRREGTFEKLDDLMKNIFSTSPYVRDGNYVSVQVENPILSEFIKDKLNKGNYLHDGSFSPNIIRMKPEAFMYLYVDSLDEEQKEELKKKLAVTKAKDTIKEIAKGILKLMDGLKGSLIDTISSLSGAMHDMLNSKNNNSVESFFKCIEEMRQQK